MSEASPALRMDASRRLVSGAAACAGCGHDLRRVARDAACPNCGGASVRPPWGIPLYRSDPSWLLTVRRGVSLALAGMLIEIVLRVFHESSGLLAGVPPIITAILPILSRVLCLVAVILITAREPRASSTEASNGFRRMVRACAIIASLGAMLWGLELLAVPDRTTAVVAGALTIVGLLACLGQFVYLRRFARRIPHAVLAESTTAVMWGFVVSSATLALATLMGQIYGLSPLMPDSPGIPSLLVTTAVFAAVFSLAGFGLACLVLLGVYGIILGRVCERARRLDRGVSPSTPPGALFAHHFALAARADKVGQTRGQSEPRATPTAAVPATSSTGMGGSEILADLTAALWRDPDSPEAHYNLAITLASRGRTREAVQQYEEAVRLKEDFLEARLNLSNCLARQGRHREAIEQLQIVLQSSPALPVAHYNIGNLLMRSGQTEAAIRHYREVVAAQPGFAGAHYNLGVALMKGGSLDEAAGEFRAALAINPGDARVREKLTAATALRQGGGGESAPRDVSYQDGGEGRADLARVGAA